MHKLVNVVWLTDIGNVITCLHKLLGNNNTVRCRKMLFTFEGKLKLLECGIMMQGMKAAIINLVALRLESDLVL